MKKIRSAVWQHCLVTLVKTGQSGNSPGREPTIKGSQLNSNDSKEGGNSLIKDKGCPKCRHESLVNLGPIAFTIRWHLSFLPALTSYDFTLRSSDKGTLLCTGSRDTREKEQRGEVWISERKDGEERKGEKGKKGYLWHAAANSSQSERAPHKHTHGEPSLFFTYLDQLPVKPRIADMSQKSICSSLAKIRSFALYYTSFQLRFHCSKNDRWGGNYPTLRPTMVFSTGDVLHLLVQTTTTERDANTIQQTKERHQL